MWAQRGDRLAALADSRAYPLWFTAGHQAAAGKPISYAVLNRMQTSAGAIEHLKTLLGEVGSVI